MTKAQIFYNDIGDYLAREKKLEIVKEFGLAKETASFLDLLLSVIAVSVKTAEIVDGLPGGF